MRKGAKRRSSWLYRRFQKLYSRVSAFKPSYRTYILISIGATIFLLGGGVYDILLAMNPPEYLPYPYWIFWPTQTGIVFFRPGLQEELLGGSIIIMLLYALGTGGLLLIYRSTKYLRSPRQAAILLSIGLVFTLVAFALVEWVIYNYKV